MKKPDWEAYALGELSAAERSLVEQQLAADPDAAVEAERLGAVVAALRRLPEEEPPRRIAFVSDKVFEPKWYHGLWPRFAAPAVAMLATAIIAHGYLTRPIAPAAGPQVDVAAMVEAEVAKRIEPALAKVRAESDTQSKKLVTVALDEAEKKFVFERNQDRLAMEASYDQLRKQVTRMLYASVDTERRQ